jgi:hypothetical protein
MGKVILGNTFLKSMYSVFDMEEMRMGFAPIKNPDTGHLRTALEAG